MGRRIILGIILILCTLGVAFLVASQSPNRVTTIGNGTGIEELASVQIREYEGRDLSSITDYRENSTRGPQYIDMESYELKVTGFVENPVKYTFEEVINNNQNYKKVVTLKCVEGWSVTLLW